MTKVQRQKLLDVLHDVHSEVSRAIHARHDTADVTTASDEQPVIYCATCKIYYPSDALPPSW